MSTPLLATFNTGSSSLKFSLYEISAGALGKRVGSGKIDDPSGINQLTLKEGLSGRNEIFSDQLSKSVTSAADLIPAIATGLERCVPKGKLVCAGHRIVHGGPYHSGPAAAHPTCLDGLDQLSPFAPDHQPHNLDGVRQLQAARPELRQSLSFDTAFHRNRPWQDMHYAIPQGLTNKGLLRYGFHGLSYAWIARQLPVALEDHPHFKTIVLHLGSGASLCALMNGKSVSTTMGLTALSGIPMATRSGEVDAGLVFYLIEQQGLSSAQTRSLLSHISGLAGMSGETGNMRTLLQSDTPAAKQAITHFVHQTVKAIGAMMTVLNGLDAIVFTGGVGENAAEIRRLICQKLFWTGLELNPRANHAGETIISRPRLQVTAAVIPANEEAIIAEETATVCLPPEAAQPPLAGTHALEGDLETRFRAIRT